MTQIDYLIVTHFHGDHMGGALQLAERLPIRNFIDHGTTVDEGENRLAAFRLYTDLRERRRTPRGGSWRPPASRRPRRRHHRLRRRRARQPRSPAAGGANPHCEGFTFHGEDITSRYGNAEDDQSISTFVGFGAFRSVIMGDLNWNKEHTADVPGRQGWVRSICTWSRTTARKPPGSEALVYAIAPRAAIMNNGPRKGGAVQTFEILAAADNPPDLWQNHYSIPGGEAHNRPERFIANLEEDTELADGRPVHMGTSHWIHVSARRDGSFTVTNSRNGFSRTYGPRE